MPGTPVSPMWWMSAPAILHISAIWRMVATSAPSCEVPIAVSASLPRLCTTSISLCAYSCVMPGTVPGAGSRIISAPAAMNASASAGVMIFSPPSPATPDACILPAASSTRSPTAAEIAFSASTINSLLTPLPGLPVRTIKSTPISAALRAFSAVAKRPPLIFQSVPSLLLAACRSQGSRLMPTTRPVRRLSSRTVSTSGTFGSALMTGCCTSNIFSSRMSALREAAYSAFVTSTSSGGVRPMVSHASTRPSLPAIASSSSALVYRAKSLGVQSSRRFTLIRRHPPQSRGQCPCGRTARCPAYPAGPAEKSRS